MIGAALSVSSGINNSANAKDYSGWRADTANSRCALQFYRPAGEVLFELQINNADRSYAVNGMILLGYKRAELYDLRIAVVFEDETVLLSESSEALDDYLSQVQYSTSVGPFFRALDNSEAATFELETGGVSHTIPMDGYKQARSKLEGCIGEFVRESDPPRAPRLTSFDGVYALGKEASRRRLLSQKLEYTLTVDAKGKPIDCELSRKFRMKATRLALCRPLLKHMKFEPARNERGEPVEGTYTGIIDFDMWMSADGYIED